MREDCSRGGREACARVRRGADGVSGPVQQPEPATDGGRNPDGPAGGPQGCFREGAATCSRAAGARVHSAWRDGEVPARVFGRPTAEALHCAQPDGRTEGPALRRGDERAGRVGAGADSTPARRPEARSRAQHTFH